MKLIRQTPTQRKSKAKEIPTKIQGIPRITKQEEEDVEKWRGEHMEHAVVLGMKTGAWFGLQWDSCPDYINIECGCGATYIRRTYKDKPVCSSGDAAKLQTKNFGVSQ